MSSRIFWLVDPYQEAVLKEFRSKAPREAALKAATQSEERICLVDTSAGKLHVFRGQKIPLSENEVNEYTRSRNIEAKPSVAKMAYRNLKCVVVKNDLDDIYAALRDMME